MSKEDYLASLPKFEAQPEAFKGRFDIPVVVETRIPVVRQCELAGIGYHLSDLEVADWPQDPQGYKTPNVPYVTWMQDGSGNRGESVDKVRGEFAGDERGATIFDGVSFCIAHPQILENHYIDLPGTSVGSGRAPYLRLGARGPGLDHGRVDAAGRGGGSATCGRT
ncbi:MAG: hypothetical protein HY377_00600 [Candidatus Blackburnbacteria bacterium]|nr:hypothetical protein [Candidatus Blackburnbacteria bacterium]